MILCYLLNATERIAELFTQHASRFTKAQAAAFIIENSPLQTIPASVEQFTREEVEAAQKLLPKEQLQERLDTALNAKETPEEKAARRAAFAEKMAGKSFEEMGKIVTHEKYVPGESKEDGKAA